MGDVNMSEIEIVIVTGTLIISVFLAFVAYEIYGTIPSVVANRDDKARAKSAKKVSVEKGS